MNPDPIANDARRARRARRLPPNAACLTCGITNPVVLRLDGTSKPLLLSQEHHIVGRQTDDDLVAAQCHNCHAIRHEQLRDLGIDLRHPTPNGLEQLLTWLVGVAEFLKALVESALRLATWLAAFIPALDQAFPAWRQLLEAQPT